GPKTKEESDRVAEIVTILKRGETPSTIEITHLADSWATHLKASPRAISVASSVSDFFPIRLVTLIRICRGLRGRHPVPDGLLSRRSKPRKSQGGPTSRGAGDVQKGGARGIHEHARNKAAQW